MCTKMRKWTIIILVISFLVPILCVQEVQASNLDSQQELVDKFMAELENGIIIDMEEYVNDFVYNSIGSNALVDDAKNEIARNAYEALIEHSNKIANFVATYGLEYEKIVEITAGVNKFISLANKIPIIMTYAKDFKEAVEVEEKKEEREKLIKVVKDTFSICSSLSGIVPVIGPLMSMPFDLGNIILDNLKGLFKKVDLDNLRYAYIAAQQINDGTESRLSIYMDHCRSIGLVDRDSLTKLRGELETDKEVVKEGNEILEFLPNFYFDGDIQTLGNKISNMTLNAKDKVEYAPTVYDLFERLLNLFPDEKYNNDYWLFIENGKFVLKRRDVSGKFVKIASEEGVVNDAEKTTSPLVIDLDGDGVETMSLAEGTYFDHNGDGFTVRTGWVGASEGILARDINDNGKIDNGTELFGNNTVLKNGKTASNGFEALKELDLNNDGIFNSSEAAETGVVIWIDTNGDGRSAKNELYTFEESGIESINVAYENIDYLDAKGNMHKQISSAFKINGEIVDIIDIWFARDVIDSIYSEDIVIPNDIYRLPNIRGYGKVCSLHQAMTLDESRTLKGLVEKFMKEADRDKRIELSVQIIYSWTGEKDVIKVFEALFNKKYNGGTGSNAMKLLNEAFDLLTSDVYENLMSASHLKKYYETRVRNSEGKEDMTVAAQDLLELLKEDQDAGEKDLADLVANIHELALLDEFEYASFRDMLFNANPRYGVIADGVYSNSVFGSSKTNILSGLNTTNNIFFVMDGSYTINGGQKNDTYVFSNGFGDTVITDTGGEDILLLGQDVILDNVSTVQIFHDSTIGEYDLKIMINNSENSIVIKNYKADHKVSLMFSNGQSVDVLDLLQYEEVHSVEDLRSIHMDKNYKLMADIDLENIPWNPLGTEDAPYNGVFNGNGYVIRNLKIDLPEQSYVGLFGYNKGALLNIIVEGASISGKDCVGTIAGYSNGALSRLSVKGIENISGGFYTGGIVGQVIGNISFSSVEGDGTITGNENYAGGISGYVDGYVKECTVKALQGINGKKNYVGGLIGKNTKGIVDSQVSDVESIDGGGLYTGGLAGFVEGDVQNNGVVEINGVIGKGSYTGGLVGCMKGLIKENSVAGVGVKGVDYTGGLAGLITGQVKNCKLDGAVQITGTGSYVGGLAGSVSGNVQGSEAEGLYSVTGKESDTGGLIGCLDGTVRDSSATGDVMGQANAGGLVGEMKSSSVVERCYAAGTVRGTNYNGGLVGLMYYGTVRQSYALGDVEGQGMEKGGLIGYANTPKIRDSFSTGGVPMGSYSYGFIGKITGTSDIANCYALSTNGNGFGPAGKFQNCYYNKDLSIGSGTARESGKTTEELKDAGTYAGWDFETVWKLEKGAYPVLQRVKDPGETVKYYQEIATAEELKGISRGLSGRYRLVADIDLAGQEWVPVGSKESPFMGSFDGNGYTISNLSINSPDKDYQGLFGYSCGTLEKVKIKGFSITGKNYVGSIAGYSGGTIMDSGASDVMELKGADYTGGIVGSSNGDLLTCTAAGVGSIQGNKYTGGLAGLITGQVKNCKLDGAVQITGTGSCVGGLAGSVSGNVQGSEASGLYSVTGKESDTGGLIGCLDGTVRNSSATGDAMGQANAGGLVGEMKSSSVVERCYAAGTVRGTNYNGGLVGLMYYGTVRQSYALGDVEGQGMEKGGLIGYANTPKIRDSFSTGGVPMGSYSYGFIGKITGTSDIANCYALSTNGNGFGPAGKFQNCYYNKDLSIGSVTEKEGARTTQELLNIATYIGWDFETIWEWNEGSYPTLRNLKAPQFPSELFVEIIEEESESSETNVESTPEQPESVNDETSIEEPEVSEPPNGSEENSTETEPNQEPDDAQKPEEVQNPDEENTDSSE